MCSSQELQDLLECMLVVSHITLFRFLQPGLNTACVFPPERLKVEGSTTVIGIDNFNDYYSVQLKRERATYASSKGVTMVEGDVCDKELLNKLIEENHITHVVHLAAQAGVRYSLKNPQSYVRNNVECYVNLLETLKDRADSVKLVYASSSSGYTFFMLHF